MLICETNARLFVLVLHRPRFQVRQELCSRESIIMYLFADACLDALKHTWHSDEESRLQRCYVICDLSRVTLHTANAIQLEGVPRVVPNDLLSLDSCTCEANMYSCTYSHKYVHIHTPDSLWRCQVR